MNPQDSILVNIEPKEILCFDIYPQDVKSSTSLMISNKSTFSVVFKIKTSASASFSICPEEGIIQPNSGNQVIITYNCLKSNEVLYKFLVTVRKLDGESAQCLEFKLWTKFNVIEGNSSRLRLGSPGSKAKLTEKISKLRAKIAKNKLKLEKSQETNYLTHEKLGALGSTHLVALFFVGFIIGLTLNYNYFQYYIPPPSR